MPKNSRARDGRSGGVYWILEIDDDGVETGSWWESPILASGTFEDNTAIEESADEAGDTYHDEGARTVKYPIVHAQRDRATLRLTVKTWRGKRFRFIKEETRTAIDGNHQYLFIPIAKFEPTLSWTRAGRDVQANLLVENNSSAVTAGSAPSSGFRASALTAGDFVCPANEYWEIIEQAV